VHHTAERGCQLLRQFDVRNRFMHRRLCKLQRSRERRLRSQHDDGSAKLRRMRASVCHPAAGRNEFLRQLRLRNRVLQRGLCRLRSRGRQWVRSQYEHRSEQLWRVHESLRYDCRRRPPWMQWGRLRDVIFVAPSRGSGSRGRVRLFCIWPNDEDRGSTFLVAGLVCHFACGVRRRHRWGSNDGR
jgi:hypothetical protein